MKTVFNKMGKKISEAKSEDRPIKPRKRKKPFWTTATIASQFGREELLAATFKDIILHLISLVFLSIYIFSQIHSSEYFLTNTLRTAFNVEEKLSEVSSASDVWEYLMGPMMEAFYGPENLEEYIKSKENNAESSDNKENGGSDNKENGAARIQSTKKAATPIFIFNENRVLGVPRIRQVKVTNSSCEIHGYFRRLFLSCYNKFSYLWEDTEQFGPGDSTAWKYSKASVSKSHTHWGTQTIYTGGGYFIDLTDNIRGTMAILEELEDKLWITRGTRAIFVDFSVYNANLNLFCISKLIFEFLPSGGVLPSYKFIPATLTPPTGVGQWFLQFLLYLFGCYALFCLCEEIREMIYFKERYLRQFWNYIDITVILLTGLLIIGTEYMRISLEFYLEEIHDYPHVYGNLETPGVIYSTVRVSGATALFFVYLRTFKYLNFNRRMAQLNNTIKNCSKDIAGFSVMFFVAYFAYAELGYLVFGSQVKDFKGFGEAMFTLLRTILGDFDYEEIRAANWLVAPIYFLSYIMLVFFILLNMFLAIINDTYADVKTDIALAPKEMEMTEYIGRNFNQFLRKLGFKIKTEDVQEREFHGTISQIREALIRCDFDDREIQMYFRRYDIDPLKTLKKEDVEKFFDKFAQEDQVRMTAQDKVVTWKDLQKQDDKLVELENSLVMLGQRMHALLQTIQDIGESQRK